MSSDEEGPPTPSSEDETKSSVAEAPTSDVHFAFGPQNYYWIRCGTQWRFVRWNTSEWGDIKMDDPYWVAFKHENGFFIGGEGIDGNGRAVNNWNSGYMVRAENVDSYIESRKAYQELHDWLPNDVEELKKISITIGPKGSYFARLGTSHKSHALPKDLEKAIQESESYPVTIALGIRGSWVAIWADGSRTWNLRHAYPSLASNDLLTESVHKAVFVALNPFCEDRWFVVNNNGSVSYSATFSDSAETQKVYSMTNTYMRWRAKRDNSTLKYMWMRNGLPREVIITPNSGAEETRADALLALVRGSTGVVKHKDLTFVGAVAGGAGVVAKVAGLPALRAVGVATWTGIGAALHMWYRGG